MKSMRSVICSIEHNSTIYNKINLLFLLIFLALLNLSCSSSYKTLDSSLQEQLINDLNTGNANLECRFTCSSTWLNALPRLKILHDEGRWRQLALETQKIGYSDNLSWYYLGRAAEGLHANNAAKTYYNISIENTNSGLRCRKCNGLNFPQDTSIRLSGLATSTRNRTNNYSPSYSLFINVEPSDAVIKIMNITPKFKQGIKLTRGNYRLKLQRSGFKTINKTIQIKASSVTTSFNMVPIGLKQGDETSYSSNDENQNSKPKLQSESNSSSIENSSTFREPQITNIKATAIISKNTELKSQPTLFAPVNGKLKRGEEVNILENSGDWVKVQTTQGQGYVYSDSLR